MDKKFKVGLVEFLVELGIVYVLFNLLGIRHLDFYRYGLIYVCLYVMMRLNNHNFLIWEEMRRATVFYIVFFIVTFVVQPLKTLTPQIIINNLVLVTCAFCITIIFKRYFHAFAYKKIADNVLVVGVGHFAQQYCKTCYSNRFSLANPVACIQCDTNEFSFKQELIINDLPVYSFRQLDEVIFKYNIDIVTIAITQANRNDLMIINDALRNKVKMVKFLPLVNNMFTYGSHIEDYDGILIISNNEKHSNPLEKIVKRCIDIFVGILGVILLIPVTVAIKLLFIKDGDLDPIIFKQERIGIDGKSITIYKFRSMVTNAEELLEQLMKNDPKIKEEYEMNKKLENDPRITSVGKFIRKTSIDELPQFINVLLGQMSLVGPRPYLPREIKDMGKYYDAIVKAKPGITGMWQVSGRSEVSFHNRLVLDEYYCKNWNIWLDFTIVIKTFKTLSTKQGAL